MKMYLLWCRCAVPNETSGLGLIRQSLVVDRGYTTGKIGHIKKSDVMLVGFEPTPMKTTALTLRLGPLGHNIAMPQGAVITLYNFMYEVEISATYW